MTTLFSEIALREFITKGVDLIDIIEVATNRGLPRQPSRMSTEEYGLFLRLRHLRSSLVAAVSRVNGETDA
jgi:hypothetical protein